MMARTAASVPMIIPIVDGIPGLERGLASVVAEVFIGSGVELVEVDSETLPHPGRLSRGILAVNAWEVTRLSRVMAIHVVVVMVVKYEGVAVGVSETSMLDPASRAAQ